MALLAMTGQVHQMLLRTKHRQRGHLEFGYFFPWSCNEQGIILSVDRSFVVNKREKEDVFNAEQCGDHLRAGDAHNVEVVTGGQGGETHHPRGPGFLGITLNQGAGVKVIGHHLTVLSVSKVKHFLGNLDFNGDVFFYLEF